MQNQLSPYPGGLLASAVDFGKPWEYVPADRRECVPIGGYITNEWDNGSASLAGMAFWPPTAGSTICSQSSQYQNLTQMVSYRMRIDHTGDVNAILGLFSASTDPFTTAPTDGAWMKFALGGGGATGTLNVALGTYTLTVTSANARVGAVYSIGTGLALTYLYVQATINSSTTLLCWGSEAPPAAGTMTLVSAGHGAGTDDATITLGSYTTSSTLTTSGTLITLQEGQFCDFSILTLPGGTVTVNYRLAPTPVSTPAFTAYSSASTGPYCLVSEGVAAGKTGSTLGGLVVAARDLRTQ